MYDPGAVSPWLLTEIANICAEKFSLIYLGRFMDKFQSFLLKNTFKLYLRPCKGEYLLINQTVVYLVLGYSSI